MIIIKKIIDIISKPRFFFTKIKTEKKIKPAFGYYALLFAINIILGSLISYFFILPLISSWLKNFLLVPFPSFSIFKIIISYGFGLALSFAWAGIIHIWILIFGGLGKYLDSYKLFVYSATPSLLFGWIPGISFFTWIWSLILIIIGTQELHKVKKLRAILMYVIPVAILFIISLFFVFLGFITLRKGLI